MYPPVCQDYYTLKSPGREGEKQKAREVRAFLSWLYGWFGRAAGPLSLRDTPLGKARLGAAVSLVSVSFLQSGALFLGRGAFYSGRLHTTQVFTLQTPTYCLMEF